MRACSGGAYRAATAIPNMDWDWLTTQARVRNRQNRLGFVVALSAKVAKKQAKRGVAERFVQVVKALEEARLANTIRYARSHGRRARESSRISSGLLLRLIGKMDTRLHEENLAHFTA